MAAPCCFSAMTAEITSLTCGTRQLDLSRPVIMGILNVTPDSFSDGGRFIAPEAALRHAARLVAEGAAMIDIGAESTRPGAAAVSVQEELDRTLPVVELIARELDVVISLDTSTPELIREGAARGAGFINDVRALRRAGAAEAVAATGLPACIMHMQGEPGSMQSNPQYEDVFAEVRGFLESRIAACVAAGIVRERLVLDPGFGFGKTLVHNLQLLKHMGRLRDLGLPLLVGMSRKSMLGQVLNGAPVDQRLYAGVAAAALAVTQGARIIRVHDVGATKDAVLLATAVGDAE